MGKFLRARRAAVGRAEAPRDAGMTLIELIDGHGDLRHRRRRRGGRSDRRLDDDAGSDRNRVAAADLAARELEITRNTFTASTSGPNNVAATLHVVNGNPLPGGGAVGSPLVVDDTPYTVTRDVEWLPAGSGKSACDGGAGVTYPSLEVTVTVTWPQMSGVQPVQSTTILTPPKNTLNSNSTKLSFSESLWNWLSRSWLSCGCVSRCPRYPGGEPISFAISWLCWNSAQSILRTACGSPARLSAIASTVRVLPEPVGPRKSRLPTGRPGRRHAGQERLVNADNLAHCRLLPHDAFTHLGVKRLGSSAHPRRVQDLFESGHCLPLLTIRRGGDWQNCKD